MIFQGLGQRKMNEHNVSFFRDSAEHGTQTSMNDVYEQRSKDMCEKTWGLSQLFENQGFI